MFPGKGKNMSEVYTIILDSGGRVIYLNDCLEEHCRSLGLNPKYKSADLIFDEGSVTTIKAWWRGSIHNKKNLQLSFRPEMLCGNDRGVEWSINPLISQQGEEDFAVINASVATRSETTHITHLLQITELMNASIEDGTTLERLTSFIHQTLDYDHVAVYLLEGEILRLKANQGLAVIEEFHNVPVDTGIVGKAVFNGRTEIVNDVRQCEYYTPGIPGTRSEVAVPIKTPASYEGEATSNVIGVLNVESCRAGAFKNMDVVKLKAIANTLAIAIENGRLVDRVLRLLKTESKHSQEVIQKKAELDEFIHTLSHDLRNPLNNIAGFVELLNEDINEPEDSSVYQYINRIKANTNNVSKLIDDLLELSRVGRMDQAFTPVSISDLVKEIYYDLNASGDFQDLEVQLGELPDMVLGNRHRLTQVFANLINNAYKYRNPDRQARVVISCLEKPAEYCFSVEDNGIGINEKHTGSIFVFGFRIKEKTIDGSGAGLAISKKIVEAHGGRMWVESEPGVGSKFYFTIPR